MSDRRNRRPRKPTTLLGCFGQAVPRSMMLVVLLVGLGAPVGAQIVPNAPHTTTREAPQP